MKFIPQYFQERVDLIFPGQRPQKTGRINVINPEGYSGIVTLWTKLTGESSIWSRLASHAPKLFENDSPIVAITNLYGNGLPQMLANLAYNPQIERIAITGSDASKSAECLANFFERGLVPTESGGYKIEGTQFPIANELNPSSFSNKPKIQRFAPSDLEGICNFVSSPPEYSATEQDRVKITLPEIEFKDYPSDITNHQIIAQTPIEAWMELMYRLDRFGATINLGEKGQRRSLFKVNVSIKDPSFEPEEELFKFGFNPGDLKEYQATILDPIKPDDKTYSYGNRLRSHWGIDQLEIAAQRLKENPLDRDALVILWDPRADLIEKTGDSSAPCLIDAYFVQSEGTLMAIAGFRTHNAVSAWLPNTYGLRAIQEKVSLDSGIPPGQLNVTSRWISIDPNNAKTQQALENVKRYRKTPVDVNDPRGYFVVDPIPDEKLIQVQHYSQEGVLLTRYSGKSATELKNQLRNTRTVDDADHAMWIGFELARAELQLKGNLREL
jgi:thymidylate synthase